jgi:hypothetical protein
MLIKAYNPLFFIENTEGVTAFIKKTFLNWCVFFYLYYP